MYLHAIPNTSISSLPRPTLSQPPTLAISNIMTKLTLVCHRRYNTHPIINPTSEGALFYHDIKNSFVDVLKSEEPLYYSFVDVLCGCP